MSKSYVGSDVVQDWRGGVLVWPAGWVLLDCPAFVSLFRSESCGVLPVKSIGALLNCSPDRVRAQVRRRQVRAFAFPSRCNWVSVADVRAFLDSDL